MIIGIGIDIIENSRIKKSLDKYGFKFQNRCFSKNEIKVSVSKVNKINFFAKRFAAKEACAKALGAGMSEGVFFKDIEIFNDNNGKPGIRLHNKALDKLRKISKHKCKIDVSLSDENKYSIANVVIYKDEK